MSSAFVVTTRLIYKRAWLSILFWSVLFVLIPFAFLRIEQYLAGPVSWRCGNRTFTDYAFYYFSYLCMSSTIFMNVSVDVIKDCRKICLGLPVSSRVIASWLMLIVVALFVAMQLVTYGMYRLLILDQTVLREFWPVTGPLSFLVTLILVGYCFYWLMHVPSLPRLLAGIIVLPGMLVWFVARFFPDGFNEGLEPWNRVTPGEWGTMLGVSLGAWYLGTIAFAQVRAGNTVSSTSWERLREWWKVLSVGTGSEIQKSQHSLAAMLAQVHWRDSCQRAVMTGCVLVGGLQLTASGLFGALMFWNNAYLRGVSPDSFMMNLVGMLVAVSTSFCFISVVVVAVLLGLGISSKRPGEMKLYLSQIPVSDRSMNSIFACNMLRACGYTCLINQVVLLICLCVVAALYGWQTFTVLLHSGFFHVRYSLHIVLMLGGLWLIAANLVALLWSGRGRLLGVALLCLELVFMFYAMTVYLLGRYSSNYFLNGVVFYGMLLSVYLPLIWGMFHAFRTASRKQLLTRRQARLALSGWCVSAIVLLIYMLSRLDNSNMLPQTGAFWLVNSGLCALFLLPFATIPLAVSWNRHR
ncbi:MAG TPA: hypothetical protein DCM07_07850 [Planctomycetaceae bacterium]|nr:hypothetical protein [Planctomycetaceae bacterium]